MLILIDYRPIQWMGQDSERSRLILSALAGLAGEWLVLVDHTYPGETFAGLPGARLIKVRALPGRSGWRLWYDWQIPRLVKKHKPDLVMLTGGVAAKPMAVPQCIWMPVPASAGSPELPVYASRLRNSLRQAGTIFCFSEKDRVWLAAQGHRENIVVIRPAPASGIAPLPIGEKDKIKRTYTQGKEYFYTRAAGAGDDAVVQLLKAFSLFKKRQLSNLQLMIAGVPTQELQAKLESYKYRQDVHWVDPASGELMAAAYAVLFPFDDGSLGTSLLDAWKAGVPVLVTRDSRMYEIAGEAALAAGDDSALAGYMMSVYKDEMLRSQLIEKGFSRLKTFDPPSAPAAVRAAIDGMQLARQTDTIGHKK